MPQWSVAELVAPPRFEWRKLWTLLGPGLLMGGAAIGGGEWLVGPQLSARFGGSLLWFATFSILGQVIYNIEISRYTLYCGEPIFTGKFRCPPGPWFWVVIYLLLDIGSIFPYLAANAASPLAGLMLGRIPNPDDAGDKVWLTACTYGIFLISLVPLVVGGKIYNALKAIMTVKIVFVMGFLMILAVFYSTPGTWWEIGTGFCRFGNIPVKRGEDANGNGVLDPGEDWDKDGRLDRCEPELTREPPLDTDGNGVGDSWYDVTGDGQPEPFLLMRRYDPKDRKYKRSWWPDLDRNGEPDLEITVDSDFDGVPDKTIPLVAKPVAADEPAELDRDGDGRVDSRFTLRAGVHGSPIRFIDIDGDGTLDGDNLTNVVRDQVQGRPLPRMDLALITILSALVGVAGQGGLTNTPVSNYTRDQGWGMGHHVGAIPSLVGGQHIQLSHVGAVFQVTPESLPRWKQWYWHVFRDQVLVWMPACFFGLALPSMLSVVFLKRGTLPSSDYAVPGMTAAGVHDRLSLTSPFLGDLGWYLVLFCGFMVLAPTMPTSIDGIVRRWVDAFWTASASLRQLETGAIRKVYFSVLAVYSVFGLIMLSMKPGALLTVATTIYNIALGASCLHTLYLNRLLLPKHVRPTAGPCVLLALAGGFFLFIGVFSVYATIVQLRADYGW